MDNNHGYTYTNPAARQPAKRQWLWWLLPVLLVVAIILIASNRPDRDGRIAIEAHIVPTYATLRINNEQVSGNTIYLKPGTYSVEATADGFETYKGVYSVSGSINDPVLAVTLPAVSEAAKEYESTHENLYIQQEGYSGDQAHQQSQLTFEKSPIAQDLPYSNLVYTIGYKVDPADPSGHSIIVTVRAPQGYRNAAIDKIRELGYNPADYTIAFIDYTNPFKP